ncbi:IgG-blocking protein M [Mycoplasmoides pneumoniae]
MKLNFKIKDKKTLKRLKKGGFWALGLFGAAINAFSAVLIVNEVLRLQSGETLIASGRSGNLSFQLYSKVNQNAKSKLNSISLTDGGYRSEIDLGDGSNFREDFRNFANNLSEAITDAPKDLLRPVPKVEVSGLIKTSSTFITPNFKAGYYDQVAADGKTLKYYQSTEYFNNRVVMPILQTTNGTLTANNRAYDDIFVDQGVPKFPGWFHDVDKAYYAGSNGQSEYLFKEWNYYVANGSPLYNVYPNHHFKQIKTIAFDAPRIKQGNTDGINLNLKQRNPDYVIINGLTGDGSTLKDLELPESVKKVSIYGDYHSINVAKQIFKNVLELEFYSTNQDNNFGFNPLVLGDHTNIIYDLFASKPFNYIDLTSLELKDNQDNIDASKLKRAVSDIYIRRRFERQMQGYWAGGYIDRYLVKNTNEKNVNKDNDTVYAVLKDINLHLEETYTHGGNTMYRVNENYYPGASAYEAERATRDSEFQKEIVQRAELIGVVFEYGVKNLRPGLKYTVKFESPQEQVALKSTDKFQPVIGSVTDMSKSVTDLIGVLRDNAEILNITNVSKDETVVAELKEKLDRENVFQEIRT